MSSFLFVAAVVVVLVMNVAMQHRLVSHDVEKHDDGNGHSHGEDPSGAAAAAGAAASVVPSRGGVGRVGRRTTMLTSQSLHELSVGWSPLPDDTTDPDSKLSATEALFDDLSEAKAAVPMVAANNDDHAAAAAALLVPHPLSAAAVTAAAAGAGGGAGGGA